MKKILVLVQDYPNNNGGVALMYVHVRNKYYIQHNIDVTVLNFSSVDDYVIDELYGPCWTGRCFDTVYSNSEYRQSIVWKT